MAGFVKVLQLGLLLHELQFDLRTTIRGSLEFLPARFAELPRPRPCARPLHLLFGKLVRRPLAILDFFGEIRRPGSRARYCRTASRAFSTPSRSILPRKLLLAVRDLTDLILDPMRADCSARRRSSSPARSTRSAECSSPIVAPLPAATPQSAPGRRQEICSCYSSSLFLFGDQRLILRHAPASTARAPDAAAADQCARRESRELRAIQFLAELAHLMLEGNRIFLLRCCCPRSRSRSSASCDISSSRSSSWLLVRSRSFCQRKCGSKPRAVRA